MAKKQKKLGCGDFDDCPPMFNECNSLCIKCPYFKDGQKAMEPEKTFFYRRKKTKDEKDSEDMQGTFNRIGRMFPI